MTNPTDESDEARLAERLRQGDSGAMEEVVRTYFDRLYSLVFHQVDRNQAAAEDITQEIFLSAVKSAKSFRGRSKLYTWLCAIAHHKIADFYRRKKREVKRATGTAATVIDPDQIPDNELLAPNVIESEEIRQMIEQALSRVPPDYREVLLLKYVEGMSVVEIAIIMRRSAKAVEGLLTRARKLLRINLIGQYGG